MAMDSTFKNTLSELLSIFDRSSAGLIFEKDGMIVRLNKASRQLLGYSRNELEGLSSSEFKKMILVDDSGNKDLENDKQTFSIRRKNGRQFWATIRTNSFTSKAGSSVTVWTMGDVSRFKETEIKLHQMSLAVEQSSDSVVITDTDAIITYVNAAFCK